MVDEFRRIYHSAGARYAFLSSARNIYLEAPYGRNGFYPRLAGLRVPRCSSGAPTIGSSRPRSAATSPSGCPAPSRSRSTTAATCPRSSVRRRRTTLLMDFFARAEAAESTLRPRRGVPAARAAAAPAADAAAA